MSASNKNARLVRKNNPRSGIATFLMFFAFSAMLAFIPSYFDSWTFGIMIATFVIGIMGIGAELSGLSSGRTNILDDFEKGKNIFDAFFYGIGIIIAWSTLYYFYNGLIVNILLALPFTFGVYFIFLGIVNAIVDYNLNKRDLENKRINIEAAPNKKEELVNYNAAKYLQAIMNTLNFLVIVLTIIASIIAILTFLDQVGVLNIIP